MWPSSELTSWVMLLVGMTLMVLILLRKFYRYRGKLKRSEKKEAKSAASRRAATAAPKPDQPLMDAPPEILRWQVEMHETARELKAELDSKMGALQAMTRLAREEAARLEAAIDRAERIETGAARDALDEIERVATEASDSIDDKRRTLQEEFPKTEPRP